MIPRVSVALATFNGERFLAEQLESILRQTIPVRQIVLADDGSSDATLAIAREALASFGGELVVLAAEAAPLGVSKNFERALRACSGDIIALSDQDDVWKADKLATMIAGLGDGLLACSDAMLVDEGARPIGESATLFRGLGLTRWERAQLRAGTAWAVLLRRNVVTGATVVLRSELVGRAGSFPEAWVHDEWLAIVAAATGGVRFVDTPTIQYRQHSANQIGMRSSLSWGARFDRLTQGRAARNARLLARANVLAERSVNWPGTAGQDTSEKLRHEMVRSTLSRHRIVRLAPVVIEWVRGGYARFGLGAQDVLRDLIQPADDRVR